MQKKALGKMGEKLAVAYLEKKGLEILKVNWKNKIGEIDLLARDGSTLVIMEVKTKTSRRYGAPYEMVHTRKQKKLRQLARFVLQQFPDSKIRIDVLSIDASGHQPSIEYIPNAVGDL